LSNLAKNIKRLRIENNFNQTQLAKELHVSNSLISHWEKGDREPSTEDLIALAKFFGCTIDELLNGESVKANVLKTRQIVHVRDFKKDLRSKYLLTKVAYIIISVIVALVFPNGNQNFSITFFLVFLGIIVIDVVACFYTKKHVKTYDVDLEKEVMFINNLEIREVNKDWNSKVIFTFFLFILSIIVLPVIYMMLRGDEQDVSLVIMSVVITLLIFGNFVALIIYELRDNLKHKEIKYENFNYKLRLFLRKSLIIIYEVVFLTVYTMIIFYGRNNIGVNDLWVAIVFSPMLVFISHLLYLIELKTLNDFKINIL
jgi:transcriptional regulator with XRE-family HTH domain